MTRAGFCPMGRKPMCNFPSDGVRAAFDPTPTELFIATRPKPMLSSMAKSCNLEKQWASVMKVFHIHSIFPLLLKRSRLRQHF